MKTKKRLFICVFAHLVVGCTCFYFSVANASEASPKIFLNPGYDQIPESTLKPLMFKAAASAKAEI